MARADNRAPSSVLDLSRDNGPSPQFNRRPEDTVSDSVRQHTEDSRPPSSKPRRRPSSAGPKIRKASKSCFSKGQDVRQSRPKSSRSLAGRSNSQSKDSKLHPSKVLVEVHVRPVFSSVDIDTKNRPSSVSSEVHTNSKRPLSSKSPGRTENTHSNNLDSPRSPSSERSNNTKHRPIYKTTNGVLGNRPSSVQSPTRVENRPFSPNSNGAGVTRPSSSQSTPKNRPFFSTTKSAVPTRPASSQSQNRLENRPPSSVSQSSAISPRWANSSTTETTREGRWCKPRQNGWMGRTSPLTSTEHGQSVTSGKADHRKSKKERPWTAPPTLPCRYKDFMEREEEYQTEMKEKERGKKIVFNRQYSETTKRHHEEVIRTILEDFDLETTKDKYRNSNACEIRRNGRSLADFRFRSELLRMMGTDVIRLSDQSWTMRLQDCLREDYERQLEEQMYTLAEAENQRMHRLRLGGVIQEASNSASDDIWKRAFENKGTSRTQSRRCSVYVRPKLTDEELRAYPYQAALKTFPSDTPLIFTDDGYNRRERELSARRTKKSYRPHRRLSEVLAPKPEVDPLLDEVDSQEEITAQDSDSEIYLPELSAEERREKRYKRLPRHVARLYDEETVGGLYNWAARLVGRPKSETHVEGVQHKLSN